MLADVDGVLRASTTAAAEAIGVSLDAQPTRNTAQQASNADPAVYVTVDIRPDQIVRAKLSGGSASNTALTEFTNTVASTTGLLITAAFGTAYDDGYAYGATGANAGIGRKITAVNTSATPIIAYPNDIDVGDTFWAITFGMLEDAGIQLTSTREQIDVTGDNQAGTNFRVERVILPTKKDGGATNGVAHIVFSDHLFAQ